MLRDAPFSRGLPAPHAAKALPAHEDVVDDAADDGGARPGRGARRRGLQGGEP